MASSLILSTVTASRPPTFWSKNKENAAKACLNYPLEAFPEPSLIDNYDIALKIGDIDQHYMDYEGDGNFIFSYPNIDYNPKTLKRSNQNRTFVAPSGKYINGNTTEYAFTCFANIEKRQI